MHLQVKKTENRIFQGIQKQPSNKESAVDVSKY